MQDTYYRLGLKCTLWYNTSLKDRNTVVWQTVQEISKQTGFTCTKRSAIVYCNHYLEFFEKRPLFTCGRVL